MEIQLDEIPKSLRNSIKELKIQMNFPHLPQCTCGDLCPLQSWLQSLQLPQSPNQLYQLLLVIPFNNQKTAQTSQQINLDLPRTLPSYSYFRTQTGQNTLRRVLQAYAKYNQTIGYIQGMNILAANLLWHASQIQAFFLLKTLMESYKMGQLYMQGMPGVLKHSHILQFLIMEQFPLFYQQLYQQNLNFPLLLYDWILTLFGNLIDVVEMKHVLSLFFKESWDGFYKLVLAVVERIERRVDENQEVLIEVKCLGSAQERPVKFLEILRKYPSERLDWSKIVKESSCKKLNHDFIECLSMNWRPDFLQ